VVQPDPPVDDWTQPRPLVSGTPVVVGAGVVVLVVLILLATVTRQPGLPAALSQDYMGMMAGSLGPDVREHEPGRLTKQLQRAGLPFQPRVAALAPDFILLGGRRHQVRGRTAAAWFYRSAASELALAEAFEGQLSELGRPDKVRSERPPSLHIFRKSSQTIVCWQDQGLVYVFASTLPSEQVIGLARRLVAERAQGSRQP
jgi:hypothetical protein